MSSEIAVMNASDLARLQGLANEQHLDNSGPRVPILKINHDPESKHHRGTWLLGQEKDKDGNITNEGRKVVGFITFDILRRFNHFNQTNKEENCCSKMHVQGEVVRGNKHGYVCGPTCPFREKTRKPNCKAQLVPFGMAVTEDNELVFSRIFVQGDSYMPFSEGMDEARLYKADGKQWKLPTYAFMLKLSSEKKVNGGTTYYAGRFERGALFNMEQIEKFTTQLNKTADVVAELNAAWEKFGKPKDGASAPVRETVASASPAYMETVIDVTPHAKTMTTMDAAPFDV